MSVSGLKPRRWLKRLHHVDYVATLIVIVALVAFGVYLAPELYSDHRVRAKNKEANRTHEGSIDPTKPLAKELGVLPPLPQLGDNALRFAVSTAFQSHQYAVSLSLRQGAKDATGVLARIDFDAEGAEAVKRRPFTIPRQAYLALAQMFDEQTDGWPGEGIGYCLDGSAAAFERVRGTRVTSGAGFCTQHYSALAGLVYYGIRPYAPNEIMPYDPAWRRDDRYDLLGEPLEQSPN